MQNHEPILIAEFDAALARRAASRLSLYPDLCLVQPHQAPALLSARPCAAAVLAINGCGGIDLERLLAEWPVVPTVVLARNTETIAHIGSDLPQVSFSEVSRIDGLATAVQGQLDQRAGEPSRLIARDPRSASLCSLASRVAATSATVLLTGESGCGKEVFARYLHDQSDRRDGPFVAMNCAAIPETMLEAMLFGHEKGAFTGAQSGRPGVFEQANNGTLLLDEISEMNLSLQAKLLRVLQENEVQRLGGQGSIRLNVRVLATSNRDLVQDVEQERFRRDLYYRLSVFPFEIPPLRERPEDILPLARYALLRHTAHGPARAFSRCAEQALRDYAWPGNVRELQSIIQRALILSADPVIDEHLIRQAQLPGPAAPDRRHEGQLGPAMRQAESALIIEALEAGNGSRREAASRLGISTRTLRYKIARMRKAGIPVPA